MNEKEFSDWIDDIHIRWERRMLEKAVEEGI